jgi:hypothetical protein
MIRFGRLLAAVASIAVLLAGVDALAFGNMSGQGGGSEGAKAPASGEPIKVEKAKGKDAYTVSELYEKSGTLDKKSVSVRGKVMKVSRGIMGKNWVHLRDGSGDAGKGTNNVVVTSQEDPKVGDVVTARGTLYKDKDFGAGYQYAVILEEGTFKQ